MTKPGHYAIPINLYKTIANNIILGENINVTLVATETKSKNIIAIKLHQQFAHPSPKKLLRLLNSAGNQWQSDEELQKLYKKVSDEHVICRIIGKTPQRPVVGLPMATAFQECIAMDLEFYKNHFFLTIVEHII